MSLYYADYIKEREGLDTLETDYGFATYKLRGTDCYLQDVYIAPGYRKSGKGSDLANQVVAIAKAAGMRTLTSSVCDDANAADISHQVLLAYGMKPYCKEFSMTYYIKELA